MNDGLFHLEKVVDKNGEKKKHHDKAHDKKSVSVKRDKIRGKKGNNRKSSQQPKRKDNLF